MIIIYIIIYIIGYICSYYFTKWIVKKNNYSWEWKDVNFNLLMSLLSWGGILLISIVMLSINISDKMDNNTKPPKWL